MQLADGSKKDRWKELPLFAFLGLAKKPADGYPQSLCDCHGFHVSYFAVPDLDLRDGDPLKSKPLDLQPCRQICLSDGWSGLLPGRGLIPKHRRLKRGSITATVRSILVDAGPVPATVGRRATAADGSACYGGSTSADGRKPA